MNSTAHSETKTQMPDKWSRLAWLPIPLLLTAIIVARLAGLHDSYEYDTLRLVLSVTFYTLVSLGTLYLIGRSFLASGSPGMLLLECGVLLWSLAGTVGDFVSHGDADIDVAVFNIGILLAGMCHLAGAILAPRQQRVLRAKPVWLAVGCAFALGALWLVAKATVSGWLPVFFIPGHGGTPVRYCVLISAIAMFVLSAGLLKVSQRTARLPFTSWYILALLLLAVGLFGIMIQLSLGSVVNWLSRTAQWLGGLYLLFAAVASLRESNLPLLPAENKSHPVYYRDASAVAIVLAAAAIRLTFLQALGMKAPFVTFYPAVIFAALYGGWRGGLLATVLSAIFVDYFWIEPVHQFTIGQSSDWLVIMSFLLGGAMITWVIDSMHRARARAIAAETQALLAAEREAASEALRENEALLRLAQESANVGIWDWKVETGELNFTPELNKLYGLPSGTIKTYQDWRDRVHPDDIARIEESRDEAIAKHESFDLEFRGRHSSGEYRWISTKGGAIFNEAGKAIRVFGVNIDITERKLAEEALHRYANIIKLSFDAIIVWRPDVGIVSWNRGAEKTYGFTENEALGKITHNLLSTIHPEPWVQIESYLREKSQWEGEFIHQTKDGREVIVSARLQLIRGDDGVELVLETNRDITERKRAEKELRAKEADLSEAQRLAHIGSWHWDAETDITTGSDELLRIYGFDPSTQTMPDFKEQRGRCYPVDDWMRVNSAVQSTMKTGVGYELDVRAIRDGGIIWVTTRGEVMKDIGNRIVGLRGTVQDITERKQAGEALRESEERLRLLGDNLPESAVYQYAHEPDGAVRFLYFSAGMERLNGVSVEEVLADAGTLHRQIAPEYLERLVEAEARSALELSDFDMEVPMLRPDGQVRWVQLHSRPRRLPDGRIIWDGVQTDVTNRKKAEELLLESEERFRRLVNQAPIPLCFVNKDGILVYFNDRFVQTFGYTHEDVPTLKEWWLLAYPEENYRHWVLDTWEAAVERAAKENTDIQPNEYNVTCKDGTVRIVEISGITIEDNFLATFIDLTERKRSEAALRESEAKYRNLFTNITEEVHFWKLVRDRDGGIKTWRLVDANPPTLITWDKTLDEIQGKTTDEIFGPGATEHYMPVVQKIMTEGVPYVFEDFFPNLDKYFRFTSVPFGDHFITTGADITSMKKAELALQKAHDELAIQVEERTRELREKEVLLKEVHHRVKNNMQVISSLLSLQADESKDETVREVLRDLTYRVRTMALVHEKLYQSTDLARIDFAEYARSLLSYLWRAHGAAAANVRLTLDLEPVLLPVDTGVPCGLILNELAGNALKHAFWGRSEGEVTMALQNGADGRIRLSVSDNGVGLPPGFDWREASSLGLHLVKLLSKQLRASVEVSGGNGTRFEIVFQILAEG